MNFSLRLNFLIELSWHIATHCPLIVVVVVVAAVVAHYFVFSVATRGAGEERPTLIFVVFVNSCHSSPTPIRPTGCDHITAAALFYSKRELVLY